MFGRNRDVGATVKIGVGVQTAELDSLSSIGCGHCEWRIWSIVGLVGRMTMAKCMLEKVRYQLLITLSQIASSGQHEDHTG